MSDIQDYIEYIIKGHETLTKSPPIHAYINRINNRLVLKIEDIYKPELQTPETMKLFDCTKILIDKTKNGENIQINIPKHTNSRSGWINFSPM